MENVHALTGLITSKFNHILDYILATHHAIDKEYKASEASHQTQGSRASHSLCSDYVNLDCVHVNGSEMNVVDQPFQSKE